MTKLSTQRALLGLVGVGYLAVLAGLYVHKPPNPDHGIFDYIGWIGATGGKYYVDVAEQNFPGEMLLHELAFRVFGLRLWAYRALDFAILTMGAAALYGLLRHVYADRWAAVTGAAFYQAGYVSSNGWMAGQRDVVAANLLLVVSYVFVARLKGRGRVWVLPLGMALFYAVLLRPTYALFPIGLVGLDWLTLRRHERRFWTSLIDAGLVVAVVVACAAAFVGWGIATGSWAAFHEQALLFNFQAYAAGHSRTDTAVKLASAVAAYLPFFPAAVLAVVRARKPQRRDVSLLALAGLIPLAILSGLLQNKGFGYHVGAIIPPIFGLAGVAAWMTAQAVLEYRSRAKLRLVLPVMVTALGGVGLLRQAVTLGPQVRYLLGKESYLQMMARESAGQIGLTWADMVAAAEYADTATSPNETILIWARPVSVHLLARRRSPTKFITSGMLVLAKPPFEAAANWTQEFTDALTLRPPRLVFLPMAEDRADYGAFFPEDETGPVIGPLRRLITDRYTLVRRFGSLAVFRLRD